METLRGDYEAKIQEMERAARDELKQLHDTVVRLARRIGEIPWPVGTGRNRRGGKRTAERRRARRPR